MEIPGYRIERLIAEGGMATVYLAMQESLSRHVALKLLKKFDNPAQSQRFLNEGRIIASLNHRNIITIYDIGVVGERHYISMEYVEGGDLEARIKLGVTADAALSLVEDIGGCLEFVHRQGIVHRDIKPANILFRMDGTPILTDFGIAKQLEVDARLTMDGSAVGSPYYLSPEQAENKPSDGRADIYGLGIILFELLVGRKPYQGDSHIETILSHISEPVPLLAGELELYQDLLELMLAKDPADRFSSAADMVAYIQKLRRSGSSHSVPARWLQSVQRRLEPVFRWALANGRVAGAAFGLMLVTTLGVWLWPGDESEPETQPRVLSQEGPAENPEPAGSEPSAYGAGPTATTIVSPDDFPGFAEEAEVPELADIGEETSPMVPEESYSLAPRTAVEDMQPDSFSEEFYTKLPEPEPFSGEVLAAPQSESEETGAGLAENPEPAGSEPYAIGAGPTSTTVVSPGDFPGSAGEPVPPERADIGDETSPLESGEADSLTESTAVEGAKPNSSSEVFYTKLPEPEPISAASLPAPQSESEEAEPHLSPEIAENLLRASQAVNEYRLTIPEKDNAYYYYRKVLVLSPNHEEAIRGLERIAHIYADLAQRKLDRSDYAAAKRYVERGLLVDPDNSRLLQLAERSDASQDPLRRFFAEIKALFQQRDEGPLQDYIND